MNKKKFSFSNQKGFSFLELMISISIITFVALVFAKFFGISIISLQRTSHQTLAHAWMHDEIETALYMPYDELVSLTNNDVVSPTELSTSTVRQLITGKDFTFTRVIVGTVTASTITFNVTWQEEGRNYSTSENVFRAEWNT